MDDNSSIVPEVEAKAVILVKEDCVVSGLAEAFSIPHNYFGLEGVGLVPGGAEVAAGTRVIEVRGLAEAILRAERLVPNVMSRMSGISTLTRLA